MAAAEDRVLLVAGGAGEIGAGIVEAGLRAGAEVAVPSRDPGRLDGLVEHLEGRSVDTAKLVPVTGDIGDPEGAERIRDEVVDRCGRVDAVVASLGGFRSTPRLTSTSVAAWHEVMDSFVTAHYVAASTFLPLLAEREGSTYTLVNGSSGPTGRVYSPEGSLLAVASAGEHALMRALAADAETFDEPVRINEVVPLTPVATRSREDAEAGWVTALEFGSVALRVGVENGGHGEVFGIRPGPETLRWVPGDGQWRPDGSP